MTWSTYEHSTKYLLRRQNIESVVSQDKERCVCDSLNDGRILENPVWLFATDIHAWIYTKLLCYV